MICMRILHVHLIRVDSNTVWIVMVIGCRSTHTPTLLFFLARFHIFLTTSLGRLVFGPVRTVVYTNYDSFGSSSIWVCHAV